MNQFRRLVRSFGYAAAGLWYCVKHERNFRFHLVVMAYAFALANYLDLRLPEYALLFLTFGSVLGMEAMNTAVETAVNLCREQEAEKAHPLAKLSKDAAAAGVLIPAIFSVCVGLCLFWRPDQLKALLSLLLRPVPAILFLLSLGISIAFVFFLYPNARKR